MSAAGWYADPDNSFQERFWSGTEWTADVRKAHGVLIDPSSQPRVSAAMRLPHRIEKSRRIALIQASIGTPARARESPTLVAMAMAMANPSARPLAASIPCCSPRIKAAKEADPVRRISLMGRGHIRRPAALGRESGPSADPRRAGPVSKSLHHAAPVNSTDSTFRGMSGHS